MNGFLIEDTDNVVMAIDEIKKGDKVRYNLNNEEVSFEALDDITIYHKIANTDIKEGEHIVKYAEHIGVARRDIKKGEHVHEHNVESVRENLV